MQKKYGFRQAEKEVQSKNPFHIRRMSTVACGLRNTEMNSNLMKFTKTEINKIYFHNSLFTRGGYMRIGYACKLIGVKGTELKSCTLKNASPDRLTGLIKHNIGSLNNMIDYNIENNIKLFRISSDLIPFGSGEVNRIEWWKVFAEDLNFIGDKIKKSNMRVSLHPGQYTILNSNSNDVVQRAVKDLVYHARILDSLGVNSEHKIVLHIGGAYDDKKNSIKRFTENYKMLPDNVKRRLVIENDDRIYNIEEVLDIGLKAGIPVIFDNLHNQINPPGEKMSEIYWIEQCRTTWKKDDGTQKIHYSQQAENKKTGSHSDSIAINQFMDFCNRLNRDDIDIMLEVKDKNLSCIKCINCIGRNVDIGVLEKEWERYMYSVMERSYSAYEKINELLKDKNKITAVHFYNLIESGMKSDGDTVTRINAAYHVWNLLKNSTTDKERNTFAEYIIRYQNNEIGINVVKNYLKRLAEKYKKDSLLESLYFYI